ncbi:MAG: endonuclease/exonuclease/phosphatase family protein [Paraclostridium sp.]|uniref:endonuclease/exonuclease/phosphatase family protein n=1 Tax=Paraclostridium sp. TaxID=2023273 RepID=UPI003F3DA1CB
MVKVILSIIGVIAVIFGGYFLFMVATDYKPESEISIEIENNQSKKVEKEDEISITTLNTGYCGTDKDVDFFMDGGTMSRAVSEERVNEDLNGIIDYMKRSDSDIYFLQEVDKESTRSFNVNQYESYKNKFEDYGSMFAINYKVPWVPVPITKPHGKVLGGLTTMSKYHIDENTRYDLPGKENFLRQLADLDRCMMVSRTTVEDGKELVLINAHLSAYDKGGKVRLQQLDFIEKFLNNEYKKGNYIVLGGDFNQQIPGTSYSDFDTTQQKPAWLQDIPKDFDPNGFRWAVDANTPTSRTMDIKYKKGENLLSIIDGFLVSDNIDVINVKGYNMDFKYTDHNPVTINFKLK